MRQVLSAAPVNQSARDPRRIARARAIRSRSVMSMAGAAILIALQLGWATAARAQANITLSHAGVTGALATNTNWSIAKNGGFASGTASWTVGVTKVFVSDQIIQVDGQFSISNTGTGPAPLGNIIINLQRPCGLVWVSAAADVADAAFGQAATYGNFISTASVENVARNQPSSSCGGPGNYVITTAVHGHAVKEGTFFTTAGSGRVNFLNASNNSVFSLMPEFSLAAGTSKRLFYTATFDNSVLGIAPGTELRPEVIVSVANAQQTDLNVSRLIDVDDDEGPAGEGVTLGGDDAGWSQSAAARHPFVPTLAQCNQTIELSDARNAGNPALTGTAALTSFASFNGTGMLAIDGSSMSDGSTNTQDVSAAVTGGVTGGTITNCAGITGPDTTIRLVVGNFSKVFSVCTGVDDTACDQQDIPANAGPATPTPSPTPVVTPTPAVTPTPTATPTPVVPPFERGEFCTYSEAHWSHTCGESGEEHSSANSLKQVADHTCSDERNQAHNVLTDNFETVYGASGVHVGLTCASARFGMTFTSPAAIESYLPAGGQAGVLDACLNDPSTSHSGNLGGEVLALELNVDFSAAGVTEGPGGLFGSLNLCGSGTSLDGMSISEILAAANKALGNGGMPTGFDPNSLSNLIHQLNLSFDDCHPHGFAQKHLTGGACP